MRIGIVLSTTPAYSETFFRSKIEGLLKNGFEVILYCHKNDGKFKLCPVVVGPSVSSNPWVQASYFIKEYLLLLPYSKRVLKYIRLEKKRRQFDITNFKKNILECPFAESESGLAAFWLCNHGLGQRDRGKGNWGKNGSKLSWFRYKCLPH